jgi:bud site selection protein 20
MGQPTRRKKNLAKHKEYGKIRRTRNKTKDIDQILEDLLPQNITKYENQPIDENLPGLGQHYCIACANYYVDDNSLQSHYKSKEHKKRVKRLKEPAYTINDSKMYGGLHYDK